jgi:hypothetical protein
MRGIAARRSPVSIPVSIPHSIPSDATKDGPHMYPSREARELAILLRISRELDICGDITATVDNPSELLAWAAILTEHSVRAWRAQDSGHRYVQVAADHRRAPVRGHLAAVLDCDGHLAFWEACGLDALAPGETRHLSASDLARAWEAMPITPPDLAGPPHPPSPGAA